MKKFIKCLAVTVVISALLFSIGFSLFKIITIITDTWGPGIAIASVIMSVISAVIFCNVWEEL